ncbi:MAG: hypothetical protein ABR992_20430 [Solirubrobacteraceae bacterium]
MIVDMLTVPLKARDNDWQMVKPQRSHNSSNAGMADHGVGVRHCRDHILVWHVLLPRDIWEIGTDWRIAVLDHDLMPALRYRRYEINGP